MGGMSGDSRIDGSPSRATMPADEGSCDETTMLCGAKLPERMASEAPQPEVSHPGDDWRIPELPPEQPAHVATIAKNMASAAPPPKPRVPADAELRSGYENMTDAQLEKEVRQLTVRLTQRGPSSDTDLDTARFRAAESVVKHRNDLAAAKAEAEKVEGWRVPSLRAGAEGAVYENENVTVLGAHSKVSPGGIDTGGSVLHVHGETHVGPVDVSVQGDALGAGYDAGVHNHDGSTGLHGGGGLTAIGGEVTVGVKGHGSLTFGASAGLSAAASVGVKKDGDTTDVCARLEADFVVGLCIPLRM